MCYTQSIEQKGARVCGHCGALTLEAILGGYVTKRSIMPPAEWLGSNLLCPLSVVGRCGYRDSLCGHASHRKSCKGGKAAVPSREGNGWAEFLVTIPLNLRPQGYCSQGRRNSHAYHLRGLDEHSHFVSIVLSIDNLGRYVIRPYTLRRKSDSITCKLTVHGKPRKTEYTFLGAPTLVTSDVNMGHGLMIPAQNMSCFTDQHYLCHITVFLTFEADESTEAKLYDARFGAAMRKYEERQRASLSNYTGPLASAALSMPPPHFPMPSMQSMQSMFQAAPFRPPPLVNPQLLLATLPTRMVGAPRAAAQSCLPRALPTSNLVSSSTQSLPPPPPVAISDCEGGRSPDKEEGEIEVVKLDGTPEKEGEEGSGKRGCPDASPELEAKRNRVEDDMRRPATAGPSVANAQLLSHATEKFVQEGIRVKHTEELCGKASDEIGRDAHQPLIMKAAPLPENEEQGEKGEQGEKKE